MNALPQPSNYRFQLGDTTLQGDRAKVYANAMKLKAEVELARQDAPEELFVQQPADFQKLPQPDFYGAKKTLSTYSKGENGEVRGFLKTDDSLSYQYRFSQEVAGGMVGGMMGSVFSTTGDVFQRHTRNDDGSSRIETLVLDKKSGLMDYSEWEMPKFG